VIAASSRQFGAGAKMRLLEHGGVGDGALIRIHFHALTITGQPPGS